MPFEKPARIAGLFMAALIATVTFALVAHAVQTLTTANAAVITYNLAGGANSASITPPANIPVFVMGAVETTGGIGSSDMTVVNSVGHLNELVWNGIESNGGGFTTGLNPSAGTHMMFIDYSHCVDLEVTNATSFHVHNGCVSSTVAGSVTEIW